MKTRWNQTIRSFSGAVALAAAGFLFTGAAGCTQSNPQNDVESKVASGQVAPRLQNLGNHEFPVTTNSERAQLFINQGVMLTYGFNHAEAKRSFQEAARLDPDCAMAYWGMALVLGPNINLPMSPEAEPQAYALIQKALALKKNASVKEQAYIDALAVRYSGEQNPDRSSLDRAYAEAMRKLHERYPADLDAATFYAESLMDLRPWNYWTRDMQPYPETRQIHRLLESVIARDPNHPGAIHYYIHAVELGRPELAEAGAERLRNLAPGAGHLVHMPSHIFRRIGRYATPTPQRATRRPLRPTKITSCSVAPRVSIHWPITRIISISCGTRPPWRDAARQPSRRRAKHPPASRRAPGERCRFYISFWSHRSLPIHASGNGI